ncbi:MAG: hypothetical protein JOZ69_07460 [Myxococcales bacterium]|nr:hypothetical protein [Myxococcales bacterium]
MVGVNVLVAITFPIADMRAFAFDSPPRLRRPTWPEPFPYSKFVHGGDFVRGFGPVQERRRGSVPRWGEQQVCNVRRALGFPSLGRTTPGGRPAKLAFRRLFFNGAATAKFDVGLGLSNRVNGTIDACVADVLSMLVSVRWGDEKDLFPPLGSAAHSLALSYVRATHARKSGVPIAVAGRLVRAGSPVAIVETRVTAEGPNLSEASNVSDGIVLGANWTARGEMRCWTIGYLTGANRKLGRDVRVTLARMHAEREVAALVLGGLRAGIIDPTPRGAASQALQRYFDSTLDVLRTLFSERPDGSQNARQIAVQAYRSARCDMEDVLSSVERALATIDVRPNLTRKIIRAVVNGELPVPSGGIHLEENTIMGDQFNTGNNANINSRSTLTNVTQSIAVAKSLSDDERDALSKKVEALRTELAKAEASHADEVDLITQRLAELVKQASKPKAERKRSMLEISGKGLVEAAETLAKVVPTAIGAAKAVAAFVAGLV